MSGRRLPLAPLTDRELGRRANLEFERAGEWLAVHVDPSGTGTIESRRNAWANAERHAAAGIAYRWALHIRERGTTLATD
jgi:hypothetical protein